MVQAVERRQAQAGRKLGVRLCICRKKMKPRPWGGGGGWWFKF